jgi:hypothetical protein
MGKTTAALLRDREARREALQARLRALADRPTVGPLRVGPAEIDARLDQLDDLLTQDSARATSFPADPRADHDDAGGGEEATLLTSNRSREGG